MVWVGWRSGEGDGGGGHASTAMATAVRTTSTSGVDGPAWRNQCRTAARSAALTTPASSSGSRSASPARCERRSPPPVPARRRLGPSGTRRGAPARRPPGRGTRPASPSGSPSWPAGPYRPATTSTRASASDSPAGRSARSAARRAPRRVVGQTIAASLLGEVVVERPGRHPDDLGDLGNPDFGQALRLGQLEGSERQVEAGLFLLPVPPAHGRRPRSGGCGRHGLTITKLCVSRN